MKKNKKIAIVAGGVLLVALAGVGIYKYAFQNQPMPIEEEPASSEPSISLVSESSASEDDYVIPPLKPVSPKTADETNAGAATPAVAHSKPDENNVTVTPNNNGGNDYTVSRPEYSQPPEDETIYDEPEDEGTNDNNGGTNTPDGGSQGQQGGNEPQGGGGNTDTTPPAPDKPQGGGDNSGTTTPGGSGGGNGDKPQGGKPGQIYVPGFGWIEDEGGGSISTNAPNAGTGEVIGE